MPFFENPEDLQSVCLEYFEQTAKRIIEKQDFSGASEITRKYNPPFTLKGLCVFMGITENTWRNYKEKKEFLRVCEQVENVIYTHKFEGASLGIFSPSIIARDLGLAEKSKEVVRIMRPILEGGKELPDD